MKTDVYVTAADRVPQLVGHAGSATAAKRAAVYAGYKPHTLEKPRLGTLPGSGYTFWIVNVKPEALGGSKAKSAALTDARFLPKLAPARSRATAYAAATDAANRQMKAAGRSRWNQADFDLAARTYNRLLPESLGRCGKGKRMAGQGSLRHTTLTRKPHSAASAEAWRNVQYPGSGQCECADPGCPVHKGARICPHNATAKVTRIDTPRRVTFPMCEACAADALKSGVFA